MRARNPILPLQYHFPDGEPHWVKGELYVYPSCDVSPEVYCSKELYVAHSKDLEHWKIDGPAFEISRVDWKMEVSCPAGLEEAESYEALPQYLREMLPKEEECPPFQIYKNMVKEAIGKMGADESGRMLYAPDALTVDDKSYLFFCTSDGSEGVAVADAPEGPFHSPQRIRADGSGEPIKGIDPAVFRDDDGKVYLYWGQIRACGAELTDDLTKIKEDTLVRGLLTEEEHCFHEGSSMRKIGDTYYYIFADTHRGKPTALGYATSKSPLGPFEYQGIIVDNDGCDPETWNNHGSIECVDGQWYVFYHRSTGNSRYMRRMCAEPITIDEYGRIREVPVTSIGMGDPYRKGEPLPGYQACQLSQNAYIDGERLIIKQGSARVMYRYLDDANRQFSEITYEGNGKASIQSEVDENGELTLHIQAETDVEIFSFQMK